MSANGKMAWAKIGVVVLVLGCGAGIPAYGFAGGTGAPNDPYRIATVADLVAIGSDSGLLDKCFVLVNDLDLDPNLPGGRVFTAALIAPDPDPDVHIGGAQPFRGVFDGQGHTLHRLCLAVPYGHEAGLFGNLGGLVKDLHLQDVRVSGAPCGALVGMSTQGTILRCSVRGRVMGSDYLGGLAGGAFRITLLQCESRADVTGDAKSVAGGLVGSIFGMRSQVVECRAAGTVTGGESAGGLIGRSDSTIVLRCAAVCQVAADQMAGGLIGHGPGNGPAADCYARGSVAGAVVGGLIGTLENTGTNVSRILNSYAACDMPAPSTGTVSPVGSGLFGKKQWAWQQPSIVQGCFWDKDLAKALLTPGPNAANYGTGLTTAQMQQQDTFQQAGWDFRSTWAMPENDYPILRWEVTMDKELKVNAEAESVHP
jgi:hypothetical protein